MSKLLKLYLFVAVLSLFVISCGDNDPAVDGDVDGDQDATEEDAEAVEDGDVDGDKVDGDEESDTVDGDADGEIEEDIEEILACVGEIEPRELIISEDLSFDLGPYLMHPRPDAIVVMWRTLLETNGSVKYGKGDALDMEVKHDDNLLVHEVELTNLEPNTRYSYKVQSGATTSDVHHFYTAPENNTPIRVAAWGDNHSGSAFPDVLDSIAGFKPHFLLGLGDNVNDGREYDQWKEMLFAPARKMFHELPFYGAIGNHERNGESYYNLYSYPDADKDDERTESESYYSFRYGNAFFLVINTTLIPDFNVLALAETPMQKFILKAMASEEAQSATWRFALGHYPGYSEGWSDGGCHYDGEIVIQEWLMAKMKEYKFHAYMSGHMHGYERGMFDGVAQIISGGGGGSLDKKCVDFENVTVEHYVHHHLIMDLGCDTARIGAWDLEGQEFDWIVLDADNYGQFVDEGPMANLPPPEINSDSDLLDGDSSK